MSCFFYAKLNLLLDPLPPVNVFLHFNTFSYIRTLLRERALFAYLK